jgi:L-alanine-DL-glutamate epimerase-like enolase superfamily enzyme
MQVKSCSVRTITAQLTGPFRIATGQHTELKNVLLTVELENGVRGYGEAAVATHVTGETVPQTEHNLRHAALKLIGRDISDFFRLCIEVRPYFEVNHAGFAALEMAVMDAWTRSKGVPFWRLFGRRPVRFSTDITIVIGTLKEAETSTRCFYEQGLRSFKVKIGRDPDLDLKRVLAVHRLAPRSEIILDANQGFTADTMLKFLKELKARKVRPVLLEQPVKRGDWEGLCRLTKEAGVLVCADESAGNFSEASLAIRLKAVNALNIKFMKTGILESWEIASLAKRNGIKLMIGAMMESALAVTASAHFAAALGGFDFYDLDTPFFIKGALANSPALDAQGRYDVTKVRAGIGVII